MVNDRDWILTLNRQNQPGRARLSRLGRTVSCATRYRSAKPWDRPAHAADHGVRLRGFRPARSFTAAVGPNWHGSPERLPATLGMLGEIIRLT